MAIIFKCDNCGKDTHMSPEWEHQFEKNEKGEVLKDAKGNPKVKTKKVREFDSGKSKTVERTVYDIKYKLPKTRQVRLNFGEESTQKDFCEDCLPLVRNEVEALWARLGQFEDK